MAELVLACTSAAAVADKRSRDARSTHRPTVLAFDVTGSLLNMGALSPFFERLFGDGSVVHEWFGQTILYSETATLTGRFTRFSDLSGGILRMLGAIHRVAIRSADVDELKELLSTLPAYPDVPLGLRKLKDAGFRLVTLTDSPRPVSSKVGPLANAGLADLFERQFAADSVRQHMLSRTTYQMVSQELNVSAASVCLVAAHVWNLIGAKSAGCLTALLARNGVAPLMLAGVPQPDVIGPDLTEVADALVRLNSP